MTIGDHLPDGGRQDLAGMSVEALDGSIGKVEQVLERPGGSVLLVDTGPWIFGKTVMLPGSVVTRVDAARGSVSVQLTKAQVKESAEPTVAALEQAVGAVGDVRGGPEGAAPAASAPEDVSAPALGSGMAPAGESPSFEAAPPAEAAEHEATAGVTQAPDASETSAGTEAPDFGQAPDLTESPERAEAPDLPEAPDLTESPERAEAPDLPEAPDLTESSERAEAPDLPEAPDLAGSTERPEAPDFQEAPDLAGSTEQAEASDLAEAPEHEESPDSTDTATAATTSWPPEERPAEERTEAAGTATAPERSEDSAPAAPRSDSGRRPQKRSSAGPPIPRYESLTAAEVIARVRALGQRELREVERYEASHQSRQSVLTRIESLREDEPWRGYDGHNVQQIKKKLAKLDADGLREVRDYERRHRARTGVLDTTRRRLQDA